MKSLQSLFLVTCLLATIPAEAGWELLNVEVNDGNQLIDISMPTERDACAVGAFKSPSSGNSEPRIMCTSDGGQTWYKASLEGFLNIPVAVSMVDAELGFLTSMSLPDPKIYRTENGGRSWSEQTLPQGVSGMLSDIFFLDENRGWAVGGSSALYTEDGGTTWQTGTVSGLGEERALNGVFFVDASHGWVVGGVPMEEGDEWTDPVPPHDGIIMSSEDGGHSWQAVSDGYAGSLQRIWFANSQHGWAVGGGEAGLILHTGNGGAAWDEQTVPSGQHGAADFVTDVVFTDVQTGYAVGNIGEGTPMVLMTEDGGGTWSIDDTYQQAFEGLSGLEAFAKYAMLSGVSFPMQGRGMICGAHMVVVGFSGQGFCQDADADGHEDESCGGDDCDDSNPYVNPSAEEICNGLDENCDGVADETFDLTRDPNNCGECGFNCQPAQVCWDSECVLECPEELTRCGQECVDPTSDPDHCGGCDNKCDFPNAEAECLDSECYMGDCLAGFVDLDGNPENGCEYECTPDGEEVCDQIDNDCDGQTDEGLPDCQAEDDGGPSDGGTNDGGEDGADMRQYDPEGGGCSCVSSGGEARGVGLLLLILGFIPGVRRKRLKRPGRRLS